MIHFKRLRYLNFSAARVFGLLLLALFAWTALPPSSVQAQIVKTSRVDLTDAHRSFPLGPYIYLTPDPAQRYSGAAIYQSHLNNKRGAALSAPVINFGPTPKPSWLLFSLTNNTDNENWVLDFGSVLDGRLTQLKALQIRNEQTGETLLDWKAGQSLINAPGAFTLQISQTALPVKIPSGANTVFSLFVAPDNGFLNTIAPELIRADDYTAHKRAEFLMAGIFKILLIAMCGVFIALSLLHKSIRYCYFALQNLAFFTLFLFLNATFLQSSAFMLALPPILLVLPTILALVSVRGFFNLREHDAPVSSAMLIHIGTISVITLLSAFLPGENLKIDEHLTYICALSALGACVFISMNQSKEGKYGGYPILFSGLLSFLAYGLLYAEALQITALGALTGYIFWTVILVQGGLQIFASLKRVELLTQDEMANVAREYRTAQSLARLKQSKETADQARLLRVIERERELMAELREREIQRTEEMRLAKDAADEANRAKSAFLAVVSHEIRTPMNGIMGIVRLMLDTKMTKQQTDYLQTVHKSGDAMMALLNDILDFEKIETGNMELEQISFDMTKLVEGVERLMAGHAQEKNLTLKTNIAPHFPPLLRGDPTRLRQIFLNLVNNAIKFTAEGGITIHLKSNIADKSKGKLYEIYCAVEDTGIGIPKEAQAKLFSPFTQADKGTSRKYGGTGLGLAICMRLLEAMGSSIKVRSEPGQGSAFYFTLFLEAASSEDMDEDADSYGSYSSAASDLPLEDTVRQTPLVPDAPDTAPMRILVIDDNATNRKVLRGYLELKNHSVTEAESAEDGYGFYQDGIASFDIILTDIQLFGMDGMEFTRKIRALGQDVPVIAVTGNISAEDRKGYEDAGINDVIEKPIDPKKLYELLALHGVKSAAGGEAPAPEPSGPTTPEASTPEIQTPAADEPAALTSERPAPMAAPNSAPEKMDFSDEDEFDSFAEALSLAPDTDAFDDIEDTAPPSEPYAMPLPETAAPNTAPVDTAPLPAAEPTPAPMPETTPAPEPQAPMAAPEIDTGILDPHYMQSLAEALPKDQFAELLQSCLDKNAELTTLLTEQLARPNFVTLADRGHELKGMAANFGFMEMSEIGGTIEKAAKNNDFPAASNAIRLLPEAKTRAEKAAQDWLDRL